MHPSRGSPTRRAETVTLRLFPEETDGTKPQTVPTVPLYQKGTRGQSIKVIKKDISNQRIEDSKQTVSSRYSGTVGTVPQRETFLERINGLRPFDEDGARAIVGEAIK